MKKFFDEKSPGEATYVASPGAPLILKMDEHGAAQGYEIRPATELNKIRTRP